jgi:hypothetical protein
VGNSRGNGSLCLAEERFALSFRFPPFARLLSFSTHFHAFVPDSDSKVSRQKGTWNSSHFFRIVPAGADTLTYRLTSTVFVSLEIEPIDLSGTLTRKVFSSSFSALFIFLFVLPMHFDSSDSTHSQQFQREAVPGKTPTQQAKTMGMMIEEAEIKLRDHIDSVYFTRVAGIVSDLRSVQPLSKKASLKMALPDS